MSTPLRDYLKEKGGNWFIRLEALWDRSAELHNRQNRPDSNENGRPHVEMVELNIWRLVKETTDYDRKVNLGRFNQTELFLLSGAACCHDFDKALKSALPPGFVHGEGSADFLLKNAERLGLSDSEAAAIASVIRLHDLKAEEFQTRLQSLHTQHATPFGSVNVRLLATLLKAADILHADGSRIATLAVDPTKLTDLDRKKYLARRSTRGWIPDGARVTLQAEPRDSESATAVAECFDYMKTKEWTAVSLQLQLLQFPHVLELQNDGVPVPPPPKPGPLPSPEPSRGLSRGKREPLATEAAKKSKLSSRYQYPNRLASASTMVVSLAVGVRPHFLPVATLDWTVDTGAEISILTPESAHALGLEPGERHTMTKVLAAYGGFLLCSEHIIGIHLGPTQVAVPVLVPVQKTADGSASRHDFPRENLLSLNGFLNRMMICFTTDMLFVSPLGTK